MRPEFVWVFDPNRRVYPPAPPGRLWASGGPIWREHWRKLRIVDENKCSWIDEHGKKYAKSASDNACYCFSEQYIDRCAWVVENRHKIADAVQRLDYDKLVKVAEVIGYSRP